MKRFTVILLVLAGVAMCVESAFAQSGKGSNMVISGQGWYGYDIEKLHPNQTTFGYMTYDLGLGFQTEPGSGNQFAQQFGFPIISVGMSVARMGHFQFSDHTKFPDLYSLYGSFERSLLRRERFSLGYLFDFGATYNPGKYDPVQNPGNNWLSAPFMAYFGVGAFAKVHIGRRWEVGADFMFRHYSNGRLALPNEAINALGAGVFARYRLSDYEWTKYTGKPQKATDFKKGMQYMITFGTGFHTCQAEWNKYAYDHSNPDKPARVPTKEEAAGLKAHPKYSLSFDAMYRYALRYATGIGVDMFYSSNMKELEAADRILYGDAAVAASPGYNPISVGVAVVQEVYWRNFAVHIAIGAYPYRHKGVNDKELNEKLDDRERGWHYEKAGVRYYFPKLGDTYLGFAIKSHSIKAEYLEFSIGIRL